MTERRKGRCQFVVALVDASEMFDASEEAFDRTAVSVEMGIEAALGKTNGARWNYGLYARAEN